MWRGRLLEPLKMVSVGLELDFSSLMQWTFRTNEVFVIGRGCIIPYSISHSFLNLSSLDSNGTCPTSKVLDNDTYPLDEEVPLNFRMEWGMKSALRLPLLPCSFHATQGTRKDQDGQELQCSRKELLEVVNSALESYCIYLSSGRFSWRSSLVNPFHPCLFHKPTSMPWVSFWPSMFNNRLDTVANLPKLCACEKYLHS